MEFEQIKQLVPQNGERYILVEDGKPKAVLVSFEDYQKNFKQPVTGSVNNSTPSRIEKSEPTAPAFTPPPLTQQTASIPRSELTLEDLPF